METTERPQAAPRPADALAALRAAADAGDTATTLRLAGALDPATVGPGIVSTIVHAALVEARPEGVAAAARFVVGARIRPQLRLTLAWQMAGAGHMLEALGILLAEPGLIAGGPELEPRQRPNLVRLLRRAAGAADVPPVLQAAARVLAARLLDSAGMKPVPAGIPFGPEGGTADLPGPPTLIRGGPALPGSLSNEAAGALASFQARVARMPPPEVSVLHDVFVDRGGLVWDTEGRPVLTYERPVRPEGLAAMKTAETIPAAVLAVEPHGNLYHWFAEWLPSLAWRLNDPAGSMPILVSDKAPGFVAEALDLADAGAARRIAVGDAVFVRALHVASRNIAHLARRPAFGDLLPRIAARAEAAAGPALGSGPIYVSRRDSTKRPMANEAALEDALVARGFEVVVFRGMTLADKITRLRRAPCVVAGHGAGLALLLAGRPGTAVVEIVPASRGTLDLRTCFAKISRLVGHRHTLWLEPPPLTPGDWAVDLPGVLGAIAEAGPQAARD